MTLREEVAQAKSRRVAIAHFNISDSTQFNAIVKAAHDLGEPVVIGVSEGESDFLGLHAASALVAAAKAQGKRVYLNADHSYSAARAISAIDAGFDSVIIDGAKASFEDNVLMTKEVVAYARASGRDVLVEAELGYIGTSSKLLEALPDGVVVSEATMTSVDEASRFIGATGIDLLAPAVGNVHGIVASGNPRLSISRIKELSSVSTAPLVLHGGSGTSDADFVAAVEAGIAMIHINTEIRLAYRKGIEASLAKDLKEVAPYRFLEGGRAAVEETVRARIELFTGRR